MVLLQQIIELLSRPPGSVIYHILTLFALQVVLALAITRRQLEPNDEGARRMMLAAGGILVARLILLFVGLLVAGDLAQARGLLPPLEQAIDTATVILLVWGLASFAIDRPRLADGVLLVSLVFIAVLFLFLLQDWQNRAVDITVAFNSTAQAYFWGILQMTLLVLGTVWLLIDRATRWTLRPIIVAIVLLAHVAYFFNYPELLPSGTDVAYWLRLGYLVAFPLWAVLAYRDSMRDLLTIAEADQTLAEQMAHNLRLSTAVIGARIPQLRLEESLDMVTGLIPTQFATIGLIDEKNPQRIIFSQSRPTVARDTAYGWQINMNDHAAFRLAYEQQHGIELLPRGVGARQVHELSQQFNFGTFGPVFIEPLMVSNQCLGFLMLVAAPSVSSWSMRDRSIIPDVAGFLSQALANSRRMEIESPARVATPSPLPSPYLPAERDAEKERLIIELAEARRQVAAAENRARQAEVAAAVMQQRQPGQPTTARPQVAQAAVNEAVERAINSILPIVREKNLTLDLDLKPDLPLVAAKEAVLKQLIVSLLENACLASAKDGQVLVKAAVSEPNGHKPSTRMVMMSFTDCGAGIQADDRQHVFNTQYHMQGGKPISGLGNKANNLPVIQKLAQAGGGDLLFRSEPGRGTTFTLNMPVAEVRPWTIMKRKNEADPDGSTQDENSSLSLPPVPGMVESSVID